MELVDLGLSKKLSHRFKICAYSIVLLEKTALDAYFDEATFKSDPTLSEEESKTLNEKTVFRQISRKHKVELVESWPKRFVRHFQCISTIDPMHKFEIINDLTQPDSNWSLF